MEPVFSQVSSSCVNCGRPTAFDMCIACIPLDGYNVVAVPLPHESNTVPYCKEHKKIMKQCESCKKLFCPIYGSKHC